MTTLTARPYTGEEDLPLLVDLINLCDTVDQTEEGTSVEELREEFSSPTVDLARDLRLWESADGAVIGFGQLWIPPTGEVIDGYLWFRVHPEHRDGSVDDEIIAWGEQRILEVGQERQVTVSLRSGVRSDSAQRIALLERHGFTVSRYFLRMIRPLSEPLPEDVPLPEGFTLRHLAGPEEVPAWVELFNLSFIDHWNHHPLTVEDRLHWLSEASYRAEQDLIIVAPDGTFAAFCKCLINDEHNKRNGTNEGYISLLGTRRGYRKLGLGRAILLAGLRRLKQDGVDIAQLGVDADSPTGATRLYESVGFARSLTFINYVKQL